MGEVTALRLCPFCQQPCPTRGHDIYIEQSGWSRLREGGGSNQLSLRKQTGRSAHGVCVRRAVMGVSQDQGTLI